MTRVLVTGGAGFIGSHVADALLARGDEVVVVDDFSSGKSSNVPEEAELIEGDLADREVAEAAMAGGVEGVVHCAARPSVAASVEDPLASNRANLESSTCLLLAARNAGVQRIVYSSSSAVYGGEVEGPSEEDMREAPMSPYGMNKLAAEQLFRMAPDLYGVDTVSLRYFNVYGPRQDPSSPYSGVISLFITAALDDREPTIYGDGLQSRDFTYVSDVVRANLLALDLPSGGGEVYNIGRGESVDLLTVWEAIRNACGRPDLEVKHGAARVGDILHSRAASARAAETLGFVAEVTLEFGLEETVAWYRAPVSSDP
jgi:UDP-glucose 4-epimerase